MGYEGLEWPLVKPGFTYTPAPGRVRFSELPRSKNWYLFGKGPTFEHVPWGDLDPSFRRMAINDCALAVPKCDVAVCLDEWADWFFGKLFPGVVISPYTRRHAPGIRWAPCGLIKKALWDVYVQWFRREYFIKGQVLYKSGITLTSAVCMAYALGAENIITFGIDGGWRYGRDWATTEHKQGFSKYDHGLALVREQIAPAWNINFTPGL